MWWAQNPDQIRTQRVENILEELGSEEQLQGEKIAKRIWSGRRWDSCFPNLIGYNMVCPNLGKKELVDRKGKVDVAGKRGGIWRVKKGGHGIRMKRRRAPGWAEPTGALWELPCVAVCDPAGNSHYSAPFCPPCVPNTGWRSAGNTFALPLLFMKGGRTNSKEHMEGSEAHNSTRHALHSAKFGSN